MKNWNFVINLNLIMVKIPGKFNKVKCPTICSPKILLFTVFIYLLAVLSERTQTRFSHKILCILLYKLKQQIHCAD